MLLYFGLTVNGSPFLYDISNPDQLVVISESGNSMLINQTGIYVFSADCSIGIAVSVPNFLTQVAGLTDSTTTKRSGSLDGRAVTPFYVDVIIQNQCGQAREDISPKLNFGLSSCTLTSAVLGVFDFICSYPGLKSNEQSCENNLNSFLSFPWTSVAVLVAKVWPETLIGRIGAGIVAALSVEETVIAAAFLAILQFYLPPLLPGIASNVCTNLFLDEPTDLAVTADGAISDIAIITAAPATTTTIRYTDILSDPAVTSCAVASPTSPPPTLTTSPCVSGAELVTGPWETVYSGSLLFTTFDNPNCEAIYNSGVPGPTSSFADLEAQCFVLADETSIQPLLKNSFHCKAFNRLTNLTTAGSVMIVTELDIYDTGTNHYDGSQYFCLTANCPISAGDFTQDSNAGHVNPVSYDVSTVLGLQ